MILIAGPCVMESEEHVLKMAYVLTDIASHHGVDFYFKASWDKANRTSGDSYRGVDLKKGVRILERVKSACGCLVTTDVHECWQIPPLEGVVDLFQIPALLSRQTSLIVDAANTGKPINIKKGQSMSRWEMGKAVEKANGMDCPEILITERGTSFGYGDVVVDMRNLVLMRDFAVPVMLILDATHTNNGDPRVTAALAKAAVAVGVDGLFIECHDNPILALCDGQNMITPLELNELLEEVC